jgi:LysM repeat protein
MKRTIALCGFACAALGLLPTLAATQTLRGSPASVDKMYRQAVSQDLTFFRNASSIRTANEQGALVRLGGNADYTLHDVSYPYVVPETHTFVVRLASQYREACGEQLVVTSATRPTTMRLANSVDESVHPTGMAVDLRKPTKSSCLRWLRETLVSLESSGLIEAVEERTPPHFHVAVFPRQYAQYVQGRAGGSQLAAATNLSTRAVAQSEAVKYQVRRGDSLWTIARRNNLTVDELRRANDLRTSRILAGQVLLIPTR